MRDRQTRRVLNLRWLVGTCVALAVIVPSAWYWHRHQLKKTAVAMLERAEHFEQQADWRGAAGYYQRYLRLVPENAEVRIRLALAFDRSVVDARGKGRSVQLLYRAVGLAPERIDLRCRLSELLLETAQFLSAQQQADAVLALEAGHAMALRVRAMSMYQQSRTGGPLPVEQTVDALRQAIERNPRDIELSITLADLIRSTSLGSLDAEIGTAADQVVDALVAAGHPADLIHSDVFDYAPRNSNTD